MTDTQILLIFVVETTKGAKTDQMYLQALLRKYYDNLLIYNNLKIEWVYLEGKHKLLSEVSILEEIRENIGSFDAINEIADKKSIHFVITCLDKDKFDTVNGDMVFLDNAEKFCEHNNFSLAWFTRDVEDVFLGQKVSDSKKKTTSIKFAKKPVFSKDFPKNIRAKVPNKSGLSNIGLILDRIKKHLEII